MRGERDVAERGECVREMVRGDVCEREETGSESVGHKQAPPPRGTPPVFWIEK